MHDPIPGGARICNYATLRRRSALSFQHYEKENRSTDIEICNPCIPKFMLPISPAGHGGQYFAFAHLIRHKSLQDLTPCSPVPDTFVSPNVCYQ